MRWRPADDSTTVAMRESTVLLPSGRRSSSMPAVSSRSASEAMTVSASAPAMTAPSSPPQAAAKTVRATSTAARGRKRRRGVHEDGRLTAPAPMTTATRRLHRSSGSHRSVPQPPQGGADLLEQSPKRQRFAASSRRSGLGREVVVHWRELPEALGLTDREIVSFVGGGGKTTASSPLPRLDPARRSSRPPPRWAATAPAAFRC